MGPLPYCFVKESLVNVKNWYEVVSIGALAGVAGAALGGAPFDAALCGMTALGIALWVIR